MSGFLLSPREHCDRDIPGHCVLGGRGHTHSSPHGAELEGAACSGPWANGAGQGEKELTFKGGSWG